uniref:hypothetical protein n=1 Tax=Prevotella sp. TaxID=59823 RepID=UPI004027FA8B
MADDQTLSLGNYEEVVAGDWNEDQCYQGSWWMIAPTQFYVKHTGSQFIYTKEQLAQMAGKEVKGMSFVFYNQSSFSAIPRTINVWVKEIDDDAFAYNDEKKAYAYFDFDDAEKVLTDYAFDTDFVDYYCLNGELNLAFDKAFAYSGDKNLLVTITFDGDETAETSSDIEFYYNTDAENMAMSTNSDYDDKAGLYMFYDYKDATVAVAGMEYAGELYDLIGNGELEIAFDKPINYSGNKNLLLTFTFEGTECCNTLDFNFFYNADMPKKAMSYFSDRRSFDEYAESVDWPYVNDDCTPKLEQPITRFFYTDAVTDNIDSTNSGNQTAKDSDAMYNLAGQRVSMTYKGIVVKNGKKYVN